MNDFEKELEKIKQNIFEIERKYKFVTDYDLITSLFNKLNVDEIEITEDEMNNKFIYIVEAKPDERKFIIKRGE